MHSDVVWGSLHEAFVAKVRLTDALPWQPCTFIAKVRLRETCVREAPRA